MPRRETALRVAEYMAQRGTSELYGVPCEARVQMSTPRWAGPEISSRKAGQYRQGSSP